MPTRFYFTATAAPAITPAYDAEWNKTANAVRRLLSQSKLTTIAVTSSDSETNAATFDILNRQLISKPLKAQTISGTVKGQMRWLETDPSADYSRALVIKVVSGDGLTVRGILLADFPASLTSEYAATLTNRNFPPSTALTPVDTQDGDYLVVEIGARAFNASTSSMGFSCRLQDGATVADLPEDETTTDDLCPWIEFSQDLLFQDKVQIYHALAQVEYTIPPDFQVYQVLAQVEYEVGHYTYNGNIPVALSPSGVVQITAPEYVRDGQVTLNLGVESEVEGALGIEVEGDVQLSLAFEFTVDFYPGIPIQEDLTGEVTISMGLSSEVALITPAMLDLDGGVGIGEDFRFDIVGPEILAIDFAGGLAAGGTLEFDIPEIVTYDHALSGGVQVGGEPSFTFFDPTTLVPPELALSGGVAVGGTNDFETIGWDELVYEYALSGGAVVGEIRLPPIETTAPEESEAEILSLIMKGGVAVSSSLNFDQDEPEIYEFTPRSGGVRVGGGMIFSTFIPPSFALELAGGVSIGGTVNDAEELVETWALAGFAFSPSMYSGFQFNSYCAYRDQAFAAGEDGIYLLEGENDAGEDFHTGLRIGPTNFGVDNLKRLRGVYPGNAGKPELRVRGEQNQQEGFYQLSRRERFDTGREVQDRVMILDIQDFDKLSHLEIAPLVLSRR